MPRSPSKGHDLWLNMGLFACLCTIWLAIALNYRGTAWDFTMFYVAAHVPAAQIYDQQVLHEYGRQLLPARVTYIAPYLRPAFAVLLVRPLQFFSYWTGFWIFAGVQFAACVAILWLCVAQLGVRPAVAAAFAFFYPAMMAIVTGQDIVLVALIGLVGLVLLRNDHDLAAGVVLGLTTYKYNLFLFVPVLFIVRGRWRGLAAWSGTAGALALLSVFLAPAGAYIQILKSFEPYAIGFSASNMISLRGPLSSLNIPLYPLLAVVIVVAAVYKMSQLPIEQAFYTGQLAVLLAGYYVNWYDGTLLLAPLAWLVAPSQPLPASRFVLAGRMAAVILLVGTLVWPFGQPVNTVLMMVVFGMFCSLPSGDSIVAAQHRARATRLFALGSNQ